LETEVWKGKRKVRLENEVERSCLSLKMWVGGEVNKKLDWKLRCVEGKEKSWIGK
jgi:hypothetical protein